MDSEQIINQLSDEISKSISAITPEELLMGLENTKIYFFRYFPKLKKSVMSEQLIQAYGFDSSLANQYNNLIQDCVYDDDQRLVETAFRKIKEGNSHITIEFRLKNTLAFCRLTLTTIKWDTENNPENCLGVIEDLSDLKDRELTMLQKAMSDNKELSQRLEVILDGMSGGFRICLADNLTHHLFVSESLARYLDYTVDELNQVSKKGLDALSHPDEIEAVGMEVKKQLSESSSYTVKHRLRTKTGSYKWVLQTGKIVHDKQLGDVLYCLFQDITELILSNQETERLMDMQKEMLESLGCGIFAYTLPNRDILVINEEARRLFGVENHNDNKVYNSMSQHILPEDRLKIRDVVQALRQPGDRVDYKYRISDRFGNITVVSSFTKLLAFQNGHPYILSVLQDVTMQEMQTDMLQRLAIEQKQTTDLLATERKYYRDALTRGSAYCYTFDVTDGYIREPIITSIGGDLLKESGLSAPVHFDEMMQKLTELNSLELLEGSPKELCTCDGLLNAFEAGNATLEVEHHSLKHGFYFNTTYFMFSEESDHHVHALILVRDISKVRRAEIQQRKQLEDSLTSEQEKTKIIRGISEIYFSIFHINIKEDSFAIINAPDYVEPLLRGSLCASDAALVYIQNYVSESHRDRMLKFTDFSTLPERMHGNRIISSECYSTLGHWIRCSFIQLKNNEAGEPVELLYVLEGIDEQKSKELSQQAMLEEALFNAEQASEAKSNFLANMSHEIRTPMNAILGMADLALREDMSNEAHEYIRQLKSAGKNLLVIINDILDYSKIESGKMDIVPVSYEPAALLNDVANIINNRIGDGNVEFVMSIDSTLPNRLYGDNVRIQQILINLLNNAVKFTKSGEIKLSISCEFQENDTLILHAAVSDTGNGIKEEDMGKLFKSFQQVDSRRNRGVEGTGLGLAITQKLLRLMGGDITVESEYNVGSTFRFVLPQKIQKYANPISQAANQTCAVLLDVSYAKDQVVKDLKQVHMNLISGEAFAKNISQAPDYIICETKTYDENLQAYLKEHSGTTAILLTRFDSADKSSDPSLKILRKPVYSMQLYAALGLCEEYKTTKAIDTETFSFIAPDADILIVDDTPINLTVAKGLLAPLQCKIDTATSCTETIKLAQQKRYDVVLMDHMMPEVDGIETTHMLRRLIPEYADIPILALTANAIGDAKDMFLREGLNDFIAKPIELKDIVSKLYNWLPKDKIVLTGENISAAADDFENTGIEIPTLDVPKALHLLGSVDTFWFVLKNYYHSIKKDAALIKEYCEKGMVKDYTVKVHSLKSCSRQIGATALADKAEALEMAGHDGNLEQIQRDTDELLTEYLRYEEILAPYFQEAGKGELTTATSEYLLETLDQLLDALDMLDMDPIEKMISDLSSHSFEGEAASLFEELQIAADEFDVDRCIEIINRWKEIL